MKAISKNVYFDVLDDIVDDYNNTYHKTIKMKPIAEECEEIIDNKTASIKTYNSFDPCKPYIASSILFLLVIIPGAFVYFIVNSHPKKMTNLLLLI